MTLHARFCCFSDPSSVSLLPKFSFSAHTAHIGIPHGDVLGCLLDLLAHSQWFHHPCSFNHGLCLDESQLFPGNTNPIPLSWATDPHAWHPIVYLHWISPRNLRLGDVPQSKLSTPLLLSPNLLLLLYSSSAWMYYPLIPRKARNEDFTLESPTLPPIL